MALLKVIKSKLRRVSLSCKYDLMKLSATQFTQSKNIWIVICLICISIAIQKIHSLHLPFIVQYMYNKAPHICILC